jgi:HSP20 family protein
MVLSKSSSKEIDVPVRAGLSWSWIDDVFRDNDWRRPFRIEQCHDGDSMVIRAELPGFNPDQDVRVEVIDGELVITAQRSESHKENGHHLHRSEFRYGSFTRSIPIPVGVDESKIAATYKDGVLEVRVALPAGSSSEATHQIEIKHS